MRGVVAGRRARGFPCVSDINYYSYGRAADMNHELRRPVRRRRKPALVLGGPAGFGPLTEIYGQGLEENTHFVIADVNMMASPSSCRTSCRRGAAGVTSLVAGRGDGTFTSEPFAMAGVTSWSRT